MNEQLIAGLLALGIPLLGGGYFALRNNANVFRMFVALVLVALGYLTATGAINDIGASLVGGAKTATEAPAEKAAAPAPAATPDAPKADAPAAPAAAPAPAPATPAAPAPAP